MLLEGLLKLLWRDSRCCPSRKVVSLGAGLTCREFLTNPHVDSWQRVLELREAFLSCYARIGFLGGSVAGNAGASIPPCWTSPTSGLQIVRCTCASGDVFWTRGRPPLLGVEYEKSEPAAKALDHSRGWASHTLLHCCRRRGSVADSRGWSGCAILSPCFPFRLVDGGRAGLACQCAQSHPSRRLRRHYGMVDSNGCCIGGPSHDQPRLLCGGIHA